MCVGVGVIVDVGVGSGQLYNCKSTQLYESVTLTNICWTLVNCIGILTSNGVVVTLVATI